jgi:aminocarboxymuconate-semialdehyde decarboxylase
LTRPPVRPVHAARAVDVHAHHLGPELATSIGGDPEAPRLVIDDEVSGRIICGEQIFRKVGSMLWDVQVRLVEMERAGVSHQVISPVPVTMEHAWTRKAAPAYARLINDSIVAACEQSDGPPDRTRLLALRRHGRSSPGVEALHADGFARR